LWNIFFGYSNLDTLDSEPLSVKICVYAEILQGILGVITLTSKNKFLVKVKLAIAAIVLIYFSIATFIYIIYSATNPLPIKQFFIIVGDNIGQILIFYRYAFSIFGKDIIKASLENMRYSIMIVYYRLPLYYKGRKIFKNKRTLALSILAVIIISNNAYG
jgi:hypothetical protein